MGHGRGMGQRQPINPYKAALRLAANRLRWDMHLEAYRSRKSLSLKLDQYAGKRAVILCNGPSLLKTDFPALGSEDVFTFGLNKINLLFDRSEFRPDAIVAVNPHVIQQNADYYRSSDIDLYLDSFAYRFVGHRRNATYLHSASINRFATDCRISINQGYTVTFVALQLAYHFGFKDVALVGCDHNFSRKGPANHAIVAAGNDVDHFDPRYFSNGMTWQLPDLAQSEASYALAREVYEAGGRRLVNCTVGGNLEILPRLDLAHFLSGR